MGDTEEKKAPLPAVIQTAPLTIKGKKRNKIDKARLIELATMRKPNGQKMTQSEIANELGVSRVAVTVALRDIPKSLLVRESVDNFRKARADIFSDIQKMILTFITPSKLKRASIQQLGNLFKMFYEKEKLELGQATEHIAVIHENKLDAETIAKIQEAIEMSTMKKLVEAKQESRELAQGKQIVAVN